MYENLDAYILKEKEKDDHFVVFHTHPSRVDIQAVDEIAFLDDAAFQVSRYGIHYLIPTGVNAAHQVISAASEIIPDVVTVCGKRVLSTQDGTWISPDDSKPVQGIESCTLLSPEIIDP